MAQPFDAVRLALAGAPAPVAQNVGTDEAADGRSKFSASDNGTLVYSSGSAATLLRWFDRSGKALASVGAPGFYLDLRLSPDDHQAAVQREDGLGGADLWLVDVDRDTTTRFTFGNYHAAPAWSPDGRRLAFFVSDQGPWRIYEKSLSGGDEALLLKGENDLVSGSQVSPGSDLDFLVSMIIRAQSAIATLANYADCAIVYAPARRALPLPARIVRSSK